MQNNNKPQPITTKNIQPCFLQYLKKKIEGKQYADITIKVHNYIITRIEDNDKDVLNYTVDENGKVVLVLQK